MSNVKTSTKTGRAQTAKKKNATKKKPSEYKAQVLGVNSKLKAETRTLGGAIKLVLLFKKEIGLDARRVKVLRFLQSNDNAYKGFKKLVRTSKTTGNYCAFYVLQALNKNLSQTEIDNNLVK